MDIKIKYRINGVMLMFIKDFGLDVRAPAAS